MPEIAQQLLEEARSLDPNHPELQEVVGRLLAASGPLASAPIRNRRLADDLISRELILLLIVALALLWAASIETADVKTLLDHLLVTGGSATS